VRLGKAARRAVKRAGGVRLVLTLRQPGGTPVTKTVRARVR
jgi:hypothetical protein